MPEGPAPAPVSAAAVSLPVLTDFPDRIPPVLVKELRQGLRGRMFVVPFLVLQFLLIVTVGGGNTLSFWHFIMVMLIFLLPSRNLGALGDERDANTLDTLLLTRLTPWRIVWGKWCSATAQSLLVAVAIVPYLLVRYLNDGSGFLGEGVLLVLLLLLSGAVAGAFTALSVVKSPLARNGMAAAVLFSVYAWVCRPLIFKVVQGQSGIPLPAAGMIMVFSVWAALFFLWHAAANISPAATNNTTPRRFTSLVAVLIYSGFFAASSFHTGFALSCLLLMLGAVSVVEMGEPLSAHPGIAAAFDRRGSTGRAAALLFRPGWDSGVVFCTMLWSLAAILTGTMNNPAFLAPAALCFFPVTARLIFPPRLRGGAVPFLLFILVSNILKAILLAIDRDSDSFTAWLPGFYNSSSHGNAPPYLNLALMWITPALAMAVFSLMFRHPRVKR